MPMPSAMSATRISIARNPPSERRRSQKEEKPRKFQAIRGTRDSCRPKPPLECVEQTARDVFATLGFGEIRPPIFEGTELFARSVGAKPTSSQRRCTLCRPIRKLEPQLNRWYGCLSPAV